MKGEAYKENQRPIVGRRGIYWCIGAWLHGHKSEVTEQLQQKRHCLVLGRITGVKIAFG